MDRFLQRGPPSVSSSTSSTSLSKPPPPLPPTKPSSSSSLSSSPQVQKPPRKPKQHTFQPPLSLSQSSQPPRNNLNRARFDEVRSNNSGGYYMSSPSNNSSSQHSFLSDTGDEDDERMSQSSNLSATQRSVAAIQDFENAGAEQIRRLRAQRANSQKQQQQQQQQQQQRMMDDNDDDDAQSVRSDCMMSDAGPSSNHNRHHFSTTPAPVPQPATANLMIGPLENPVYFIPAHLPEFVKRFLREDLQKFSCEDEVAWIQMNEFGMDAMVSTIRKEEVLALIKHMLNRWQYNVLVSDAYEHVIAVLGYRGLIAEKMYEEVLAENKDVDEDEIQAAFQLKWFTTSGYLKMLKYIPAKRMTQDFEEQTNRLIRLTTFVTALKLIDFSTVQHEKSIEIETNLQTIGKRIYELRKLVFLGILACCDADTLSARPRHHSGIPGLSSDDANSGQNAQLSLSHSSSRVFPMGPVDDNAYMDMPRLKMPENISRDAVTKLAPNMDYILDMFSPGAASGLLGFTTETLRLARAYLESGVIDTNAASSREEGGMQQMDALSNQLEGGIHIAIGHANPNQVNGSNSGAAKKQRQCAAAMTDEELFARFQGTLTFVRVLINVLRYCMIRHYVLCEKLTKDGRQVCFYEPVYTSSVLAAESETGPKSALQHARVFTRTYQPLLSVDEVVHSVCNTVNNPALFALAGTGKLLEHVAAYIRRSPDPHIPRFNLNDHRHIFSFKDGLFNVSTHEFHPFSLLMRHASTKEKYTKVVARSKRALNDMVISTIVCVPGLEKLATLATGGDAALHRFVEQRTRNVRAAKLQELARKMEEISLEFQYDGVQAEEVVADDDNVCKAVAKGLDKMKTKLETMQSIIEDGEDGAVEDVVDMEEDGDDNGKEGGIHCWKYAQAPASDNAVFFHDQEFESAFASHAKILKLCEPLKPAFKSRRERQSNLDKADAYGREYFEYAISVFSISVVKDMTLFSRIILRQLGLRFDDRTNLPYVNPETNQFELNASGVPKGIKTVRDVFEAAFWMHGLIGRQWHQRLKHDRWGVGLWIFGDPKTAKSAILEWVIRLFPKDRVGIFSDNMQKEFSIQTLYDMFSSVGPEIGHRMPVPQAVIQMLITEEFITITEKFKSAITQIYQSHIAFASNIVPFSFVDHNGSLCRRFLVALFKTIIPQNVRIGDDVFRNLLDAERPEVMLLCNFAYLALAQHIVNGDIWNAVPAYFTCAQSEFACELNPLEDFLNRSDKIRLQKRDSASLRSKGKDVDNMRWYMSSDDFQKLYDSYVRSSRHGQAIPSWSPQIYATIFRKYGLQMVRDARPYHADGFVSNQKRWCPNCKNSYDPLEELHQQPVEQDYVVGIAAV
jgi:hypothetical protein